MDAKRELDDIAPVRRAYERATLYIGKLNVRGVSNNVEDSDSND